MVHTIEKNALVEAGHILRAEVVYRLTSFRPIADASTDHQAAISELCRDQNRNELIVSDVAQEARNGGGICLVLSNRKDHCETLCKALRRKKIKTELLTGDLTPKQREAALTAIENGTQVLVATGQLIGEGFDLPALNSLFLATPNSFDGRVLQYVGRVLRPAPGKDKALVFDYVDNLDPVLRAAAKKRHRVYLQNSFNIRKMAKN